jgi:hypothetical protein
MTEEFTQEGVAAMTFEAFMAEPEMADFFTPANWHQHQTALFKTLWYAYQALQQDDRQLYERCRSAPEAMVEFGDHIRETITWLTNVTEMLSTVEARTLIVAARYTLELAEPPPAS